jgi:hypothetical protein
MSRAGGMDDDDKVWELSKMEGLTGGGRRNGGSRCSTGGGPGLRRGFCACLPAVR